MCCAYPLTSEQSITSRWTCVYPISIEDLGQKLYDISLAFRPIIRLIADGTLAPVFQGLISEESLVRLGDVA
jgi:hypothetical protein